MYESGSDFQNELYQNTPNMAMMFMMYSPTFGNGSFVIQPASKGVIQEGFPTIPYMPLESLIYQQQASNPQSAPLNTIAGSNTGQQVISSTQTANDSAGQSRYLLGVQNTQ